MIVAMATVADSANISADGKLNILGSFDTVRSNAPVPTLPSMSFAFKLLAESDDANRTVTIDVTLIDEDSRPLWAARATAQIGPIPPGQFFQVPQVITLQGVRFPRPGRYRFRIRVSGVDEPYDTVLQVVRAPAPPSPQQGA